MNRIEKTFDKLKLKRKKAFIAYVMAGDPDYDSSMELVKGLPAAGVDIIELGVPFTDPMADGLIIQKAGQRALEKGMTLKKTISLVQNFRKNDKNTPIVLMGYYNPIYNYGALKFLDDATQAGIDGLIIVDLPPEEDDELCIPAMSKGLNFIRLATPTTDKNRLPKVLQNTSGFVYYVSITGITGTKEASPEQISPEISRIKSQTQLPIVVGFGVKTPDSAKKIASIADGVVIGSAIIEELETKNLDDVLKFVESLAKSIHDA